MIQTTIISANRNAASFGGKIYPSDFNTDYEDTRNITARILSDWAFDEQCRRNAESRTRKEQ